MKNREKENEKGGTKEIIIIHYLIRLKTKYDLISLRSLLMPVCYIHKKCYYISLSELFKYRARSLINRESPKKMTDPLKTPPW